MEYKVLLGKYSEIQLATFSPATNNGTNEYHALIKLKEVTHMNATEQVSLLKKAFEKLQEEIFPASLVWKRYFLSDPCNQYELFESPGQLMSLVGQAPLDGSKIAMWCYFIQEGQLAADDHLVTLSRPDYKHYYY